MSGRRKGGAGQSGQLCRGRPRIAAESPAPRLRGARPENGKRKQFYADLTEVIRNGKAKQKSN